MINRKVDAEFLPLRKARPRKCWRPSLQYLKRSFSATRGLLLDNRLELELASALAKFAKRWETKSKTRVRALVRQLADYDDKIVTIQRRGKKHDA